MNRRLTALLLIAMLLLPGCLNASDLEATEDTNLGDLEITVSIPQTDGCDTTHTEIETP